MYKKKREPDRPPQSYQQTKHYPELNQPNMILDAKYNYRLIQLSAIVKITNILQPIINQNIDEYVTLCRRFGNKENIQKLITFWGKSGTSDCTPKTFTGRSTSGHSRLGYL